MLIGFIGLGIMGSRMASNLQKAGHRLVVHDLRREAAELPWNTKIERPGVMDLITPADVAAELDALAAAGFRPRKRL